jgi:hypothetical protein
LHRYFDSISMHNLRAVKVIPPVLLKLLDKADFSVIAAASAFADTFTSDIFSVIATMSINSLTLLVGFSAKSVDCEWLTTSLAGFIQICDVIVQILSDLLQTNIAFFLLFFAHHSTSLSLACSS